jgi:hypothetical protein
MSLCLTCKYSTNLNDLARDGHSSLFGPAKGDEEKNIKTLLTGYQGFKSK